jgi:ferrous iron transport protein A
MYLGHATPGTVLRVQRVHRDGPLARRIMEMGLVEGVQVRVVGRAPFGDPLHVRVGNCEISFRRREANLVEVV